MDTKRALKWAAAEVALSTVALLVGLVLIGAGIALSGTSATQLAVMARRTPILFLRVAGPTLILVLLGLAVWRIGVAYALFWTLGTAIEEETVETFDTEAVKSDILSVLDDRLSEMHQDLDQTRRVVNRLGADEAASEFEFEE
ncbi:MAG: hypothetical protein R3324_16915 [Halobacteriales archaeon]|nr:hypothetical protein [Halobacteriales archaeon]